MSKVNACINFGKIADLIADMTINGATKNELEQMISFAADFTNSSKNNPGWIPSDKESILFAMLQNKYGTDLAQKIKRRI